ADGAHAGIGDTLASKELLHRGGAFIAQCNIVFLATTFVSMAFDLEFDRRILFKPRSVIQQLAFFSRPYRRLVVVKENRDDRLGEELIQCFGGWRWVVPHR